MNYFSFLKPFLFSLPPEIAHNLALMILKNNLFFKVENKQYPILHNSLFGLDFANPIGLAAGFDKNAEVFNNLFSFGFGFVECGTVTPRAQSGNVRPRLFRLEKDYAIINRLGFNNCGIEIFLKKFLARKATNKIVGINIGKNKDTKNAVEDYLLLLPRIYNYCSYITINISSPNTENLRNLQKSNQLENFLAALINKKNQLKKISGKSTPLLLKIAPDLSADEQEAIARIVVEKQIDGLIISNTTIAHRKNLCSEYKHEIGGLSGKPLFAPSNAVLKNIYRLTKGQIPLIGVGGIFSGSDAYEKIKSGAALLQIYSAFIYNGFGLVEKIKTELAQLMERDGIKNIKDVIGVNKF